MWPARQRPVSGYAQALFFDTSQTVPDQLGTTGVAQPIQARR
jgi:hypothetical protein